MSIVLRGGDGRGRHPGQDVRADCARRGDDDAVCLLHRNPQQTRQGGRLHGEGDRGDGDGGGGAASGGSRHARITLH